MAGQQFQQEVESVFKPLQDRFRLDLIPFPGKDSGLKYQLWCALDMQGGPIPDHNYPPSQVAQRPDFIDKMENPPLHDKRTLTAQQYIIIISDRASSQMATTGRFAVLPGYKRGNGVWRGADFNARLHSVPVGEGQSASMAMFMNQILLILGRRHQNSGKLYMTEWVTADGAKVANRFGTVSHKAGKVPNNELPGTYHPASTHPDGLYIHLDNIPTWEQSTAEHFRWRADMK